MTCSAIRSRPSSGSASSRTGRSCTTSSRAPSSCGLWGPCTGRGAAPASAGGVGAYSHGMRQKLIISRGLIHRPEYMVVDEPMVGLDPKAARLLKDIFRQFVSRGGTVLMSTRLEEHT